MKKPYKRSLLSKLFEVLEQEVNTSIKTASKVELTFDIPRSEILDETQKELLITNLKTRLSKERVLILQCGESRSQHKNKVTVVKRFLELLRTNLIEEKERIPTKTPKAVRIKRLTTKRKNAEKKANRKPPKID